jgi:hypothetical protein
MAGLLLTALGLLAAGPVRAQEKPTVHRLEIFNGDERTVHYYGAGLTADEKAALGDLERAENDLAAAESERDGTGMGSAAYSWINFSPVFYGDLLPNYLAWRNYVLSDSAPIFPPWLAYPAVLPYTGWGYSSAPYWFNAFSSGLAYPAVLPYTGWGYFNPPVLFNAFPAFPAFGPYGRAWAAVAQNGQPPRMSVAQARRRLEAARARVNGMERLRAALPPQADGADAVGKDVTVTLKNNKEIKGKLVRQTKDTLVVATDNQEIEIQRNEVATVTREKAKKMP